MQRVLWAGEAKVSMILARLVTLVVPLLFVACSLGEIDINNLNVPLAELQHIVNTNVPIRTLHVSQNGREFFSVYFVSKDGDYAEAPNSPHRSQVHVTILGDRRPYKIAIEAVDETRGSDGEYYLDHHDEGLARVMSRRIQKALHERRDGHDIIDDFRAF